MCVDANATSINQFIACKAHLRDALEKAAPAMVATQETICQIQSTLASIDTCKCARKYLCTYLVAFAFGKVSATLAE